MKKTKAVWHKMRPLSSLREKNREGMAANFRIYVPLVREVYPQAPDVTFRLGRELAFCARSSH